MPYLLFKINLIINFRFILNWILIQRKNINHLTNGVKNKLFMIQVSLELTQLYYRNYSVNQSSSVRLD